MRFEDRIAAAAEKAAQVISMSIPDDVGKDHVFSNKFNKVLCFIIENWETRKKHPIKRKILLIAAAIILIFGILLASNSQIRATVFEWIRGLIGPYITYQYEGEKDENNTTEYELTWLPEGYSLTKRSDNNPTTVLGYLNDDNAQIVFFYTYGGSDNITFIDPEHSAVYSTEINGCEAEMYISDNNKEANVIVWTDLENEVIFGISAFENEEILLKMAESVKPIE